MESHNKIIDDITFIEWLREKELFEAKNVGTIYHFTKPRNLYMLLDKENQAQYGLEILEFISMNGNFSATRNSSLTSDFSHPILSVKNDYIVRISLDGDKLSNKYKIKPIRGLQDNEFDLFGSNNRVPKEWGEDEEVVMGDKLKKDSTTFKLKEYIIQIDIFNKKQKESEDLKKIIELKLKENDLTIPINIVKKFVNIKNTNSVKLFESSYNELNILNCGFLQIQNKKENK
jgi:hypothetical protein